MDKIGQLPFLEGEIFDSVKPGLSAFADQPKQVSVMIDGFVSMLCMLGSEPRVSALWLSSVQEPFLLLIWDRISLSGHSWP